MEECVIQMSAPYIHPPPYNPAVYDENEYEDEIYSQSPEKQSVGSHKTEEMSLDANREETGSDDTINYLCSIQVRVRAQSPRHECYLFARSKGGNPSHAELYGHTHFHHMGTPETCR